LGEKKEKEKLIIKYGDNKKERWTIDKMLRYDY
jgi:hypothetical protein